MKIRRFKALFFACLVTIALLAVLAGGCGTSPTTTAPATTAAPAPTKAAPAPTTAAPAPTTAAPAPTTAAPAPTKTLKIGAVTWLGFSLGIDGLHAAEVYADMVNQKGGLNIGGDLYKIEIVCYDSNASQVTEVAGVNRLVYQDNVRFFYTGGDFQGAWMDVVEKNKIVVAGGGQAEEGLNPKYHYCFDPAGSRAGYSSIIGFLVNQYPDLVKSVVIARPDNAMGHTAAEGDDRLWQAFGVTPTDIFYPSGAADLSSMGTKVVQLNPTAFGASGGGSNSDGLALKAVRQAGYQGQLIATSGMPALMMVNLVPADMLEGFINGAYPIEFDPPTTQVAKDYKAAWIAKFGKWEGPEIMFATGAPALFAALEKAGSLDPDKVMSVITSGMSYDTPTGFHQMVTRPDTGDSVRTLMGLSSTCMKQIKSGQPVYIGEVSAEDGLKYFRLAYPVSTP